MFVYIRPPSEMSHCKLVWCRCGIPRGTESLPRSSALCLKLSSLDAFDFVWADSSAGQKGQYSLHTKDILVSSISLFWPWFKIGVLQTKGCCCQPPQMQTELCWPILVNVTINWLVFEKYMNFHSNIQSYYHLQEIDIVISQFQIWYKRCMFCYSGLCKRRKTHIQDV